MCLHGCHSACDCSFPDCPYSQGTVRATNVTFKAGHVTRKKRGEVIGQRGGFRGCCVWFTGEKGEGEGRRGKKEGVRRGGGYCV